MRSEQEVNRAIECYADTVKRICILHLKNVSDTEDIFQEVFLKYAMSDIVFENEEHEKAWLIRVTFNQCKDLMKSFFRRKTVPLDSVIPPAVLQLPQKYRNVVYLHYFEGYSAVEISKMLNRNVNTIYTLLSRAKEKLKNRLGGDAHE